MISEVAFEQISGNYWYGAYGPFRVVMLKDTGYINATKMCTSGGKVYSKWTRLKTSAELIQAFENIQALENRHDTNTLTLRDTDDQIWSSAFKCITTGNQSEEDKLISGTYIHPDLVPSVAGWVSPNFQLMANRVVNNTLHYNIKSR